jgi:hypothetical protein
MSETTSVTVRNEPLKLYTAAVTAAVRELGDHYGTWETKAYNTGDGRGGRCVAVKAEVRVYNGNDSDEKMVRGNTDPCSNNREVNQLIAAKLVAAGFTVLKTRKSWFDWGRGGQGAHAITFYLAPKTYTLAS